MRSKLLSALVAASLGLASAANADDISYSYADLAYVSTDYEVEGLGDADADGFALRGSVEITDQAFLFGTYTDQSAETTITIPPLGSFDVDFDVTAFTLGGGFAWSLSDTADLYGKLGYASIEFEDSGSFDDDGFLLGFGLRARVSPQFELEGSINYVDYSDLGDDTSLGAAARWFFTDQFSAFAEGEFGDDVSTYGIGMRWNFGGNSGGQRVAQQK